MNFFVIVLRHPAKNKKPPSCPPPSFHTHPRTHKHAHATAPKNMLAKEGTASATSAGLTSSVQAVYARSTGRTGNAKQSCITTATTDRSIRPALPRPSQ